MKAQINIDSGVKILPCDFGFLVRNVYNFFSKVLVMEACARVNVSNTMLQTCPPQNTFVNYLPINLEIGTPEKLVTIFLLSSLLFLDKINEERRTQCPHQRPTHVVDINESYERSWYTKLQ